MTTVEMQEAFLLKIKTLDRIDIRDLNSYDIMVLLTDAQNRIVQEAIVAKDFGSIRPIIEAKAISSWITTAFPVGINSPAKVIDLGNISGLTTNTKYVAYVRSQSKIERDAVPLVTPAVYVNNQEIPREIVANFETNGSNAPIFTNPRCFVEGDYLVVIPDSHTTISEVVAVVVRTPKMLGLATDAGSGTVLPTVVISELPVALHQRIVDLAVQIYGDTVNINDLRKAQKNQ